MSARQCFSLVIDQQTIQLGFFKERSSKPYDFIFEELYNAPDHDHAVVQGRLINKHALSTLMKTYAGPASKKSKELLIALRGHDLAEYTHSSHDTADLATPNNVSSALISVECGAQETQEITYFFGAPAWLIVLYKLWAHNQNYDLRVLTTTTRSYCKAYNDRLSLSGKKFEGSDLYTYLKHATPLPKIYDARGHYVPAVAYGLFVM